VAGFVLFTFRKNAWTSEKGWTGGLLCLEGDPDQILEVFGPDFLAPKGTKEGKNTIATSPAA
jgi:hypothetical protein